MANKTTELLNFAISLEVDKADVAKSIREISNVTAALDLLVKKGEINEEQAKKLAVAYSNLNTQLENVEGALEKSTGAYTKANTAQNKLLGAQQRATVSTKGFANATNNANQIMFSFGDAIQDSAQFQFGFAQGARAIGNNLAFAAEQFVYVNQKAGGWKNTLSALFRSLWGPAGIILAVNATITAFTVWGDRLFDTKKGADKAKKAVDELIESYDELFKIIDKLGTGRSTTTSIDNFEQQFLIQNKIKSLEEDLLNQETELLSAREAFAEKRKNSFGGIFAYSDLTEGLSPEGQAVQKAEQNIKDLKKQIEELSGAYDELQKRALETNKSAREAAEILAARMERIRSQPSIGRVSSDDANIDPAKASIDGVRQRALEVADIEISTLQASALEYQSYYSRIDELSEQSARNRIATERNVRNALSSLASAFAKDNKGLAISLLAIEKGIAIAQVVINGIKEASKATVAGAFFSANPATAVLGASYFKAAASIKLNTATAAAAIAAQGLAQAASISNFNGSNQSAPSGFGGGIRGYNTVGEGSRSNINAISGTTTSQSQFQPISLAVTVDAFDPKKVTLTSREGEKLLRLEQT